MAIGEVIDLLGCPHCQQQLGLVPGDRSVRCAAGHVFDVARQGYLNLAGGSAPGYADTAAMVTARDRFLTQGHYRPVVDRLLALAGTEVDPPRRLLDVGTGTGYSLSALLQEWPEARGLGLDVSVAAARRAARAHPRLGSVVGDAWQLLPVRDGSIDLLLNVFAPRNGAEFRRVLAPGGRVLIVTPEPDHLDHVRRALGLLGIQPAKRDQLRTALGAALSEEAAETLRYSCELDRSALRDLVGMGPNAFHLNGQQIEDLVASVPEPLTVTVAVTLTRWVARA